MPTSSIQFFPNTNSTDTLNIESSHLGITEISDYALNAYSTVLFGNGGHEETIISIDPNGIPFINGVLIDRTIQNSSIDRGNYDITCQGDLVLIKKNGGSNQKQFGLIFTDNRVTKLDYINYEGTQYQSFIAGQGNAGAVSDITLSPFGNLLRSLAPSSAPTPSPSQIPTPGTFAPSQSTVTTTVNSITSAASTVFSTAASALLTSTAPLITGGNDANNDGNLTTGPFNETDTSASGDDNSSEMSMEATIGIAIGAASLLLVATIALIKYNRDRVVAHFDSDNTTRRVAHNNPTFESPARTAWQTTPPSPPPRGNRPQGAAQNPDSSQGSKPLYGNMTEGELQDSDFSQDTGSFYEEPTTGYEEVNYSDVRVQMSPYAIAREAATGNAHNYEYDGDRAHRSGAPSYATPKPTSGNDGDRAHRSGAPSYATPKPTSGKPTSGNIIYEPSSANDRKATAAAAKKDLEERAELYSRPDRKRKQVANGEQGPSAAFHGASVSNSSLYATRTDQKNDNAHGTDPVYEDAAPGHTLVNYSLAQDSSGSNASHPHYNNLVEISDSEQKPPVPPRKVKTQRAFSLTVGEVKGNPVTRDRGGSSI